MPKTYQNPPQIGPGGHQNGDSKKGHKKTLKKHRNYRKWTPKWKPRGDSFLAIWLLFSVPGGLGSQNDSQSLSQEPPGPVQALISTDFGTILDDFLMISRIIWATFYLVCLIIFLVTSSLNFQISDHKFICVGVVRKGQ